MLYSLLSGEEEEEEEVKSNETLPRCDLGLAFRSLKQVPLRLLVLAASLADNSDRRGSSLKAAIVAAYLR